MRSSQTFVAATLFSALWLAACGGGGNTTPDGMPPPDTMPFPDTIVPTPDGTPSASPAIQEARDAVDGVVSIDIIGVTVTYVRPSVGNDPSGFFIQDDQTGPALFIAVDPGTLSPVPLAGDEVSFTITNMATAGGARQADALTGFARVSTGNDISGLLQDVNAATDLVTALDTYESEYISVTGTVVGAFAFAGTGHSSAGIDTAGMVGDPNLKLRAPNTLIDALNLGDTCNVSITGIMWRFNTQAQPSVWVAQDIAVNGCPAPQVVSAAALDATTVRVTFDRNIETASVVSDGSQFTFDNGLTASAASANGTTIVNVTTSSQVGGTVYTVTAATTITDTIGTALDGAANTATFGGYIIPAVVRVNEIKGNVALGCDLIELRVISGGTMEGVQVMERTGVILTFGALIVATNDYVVLHFNTGNGTCNPGGSANESAAVDEQPNASFGANFDTAFDWYMADTGMTGTDNVITVLDVAANIVDAVLVSDGPAGTAAADSETQAATVAAAGEWQMVGGGIPVGGFVDDNFNVHAVQDLSGIDTIQRLSDTDNNDRDDWTAVNAAATWGLNNVGQSNL